MHHTDNSNTKDRPVVIRRASIPGAGTGAMTQQDVLIIDGKIVEIANTGLSAPEGSIELCAQGQAVLPGFSNAHTHSHFAFGRGFGDLWTLETHLNSGGGISYGATLDDMSLAAKLGAADMIRNGCTAAYDMVVQSPVTSPDGMHAVASGYQAAGIKAVVAATVTDQTFWASVPGLIGALSPEEAEWIRTITLAAPDTHLEGLRRTLESWTFDTDKIKLGLAPSVPLLCSDTLLESVANLARDFGVPMQTHLAESKVQSALSQRRWGKSLTEHLASIGFFEGRVSAAHAIWLNDSDIRILAEKGVAVAHNPASNMRLGNGIAPISAMIKAGVSVGLGTDACSCADQQNMIDAMRLASYASRTRGPDPEHWLSAEQVFDMATQGSADLLGLPNTGRLAVGKCADLVFIDLADIAYLPLNNFWNQLVFSESGRGVKRVMVDGQVIYEEGRFTLFDYDDLRERVNDTAERLKDTAQERRARFKNLESVVSLFCVGLAQTPFEPDQYVQG